MRHEYEDFRIRSGSKKYNPDAGTSFTRLIRSFSSSGVRLRLFIAVQLCLKSAKFFNGLFRVSTIDIRIVRDVPAHLVPVGLVRVQCHKGNRHSIDESLKHHIMVITKCNIKTRTDKNNFLRSLFRSSGRFTSRLVSITVIPTPASWWVGRH